MPLELIIKLKNKLKQDEIEIIERFGTRVIFQSQYIPLLGVVIDNPANIFELEKLSFVQSIRTPLEGEYLEGEFLTTYRFIPCISRRPLSQSDNYGWGDTRVAVIDSGVNSTSVVEHIDFTNTGHSDFFGHGSHVADIIKYFAKGVNLYSAKVGNDKPYEIPVMRALEWAATEKRVHVINLSVGFKRINKCKGDCDLSQIINGIVNQGIFVAVAAGNNGSKNNTLRCPACASGAITVGALEDVDKVSDYSSRGPVGGSKPNILAPGMVFINGEEFGGTSCACPVVAGTVAAVVNNVRDTNLIYRALYDSAIDIKQPRHVQGMGALNMDGFVEVINNATMGRKVEG